MIRCYRGRRGMGKTYSMIVHAVQFMKKNRLPVYTNLAGLRFPSSVYIDSILEIPDLRAGLLLYDEASVSLNSRKALSNPAEVLIAFRQSRKQALDLYYTTQGSEDVDKTLRDLTDEICVCRRAKVGGKTVFVHRLLENGEKPGFASMLGMRFVPLLPDWAELYDTDEVINPSGGSCGIGAAAELLQRGRRHASRPALEPASWQTRVDAYTWQNGVGWYDRSAMQAAEWLIANGVMERGEEGGAVKVQRELRRRMWLKVFDLDAENVPPDCSPDNPWIPGYSPAEVKERRRMEIVQEAEEVLAQAAIREQRRYAKR